VEVLAYCSADDFLVCWICAAQQQQPFIKLHVLIVQECQPPFVLQCEQPALLLHCMWLALLHADQPHNVDVTLDRPLPLLQV
jgi:hypothetical protein